MTPLVAIAAAAIASVASSVVESWSCTYPGYNATHDPVIAKYEVTRAGKLTEHVNLKDVPWETEYTLVRNDAASLIGTNSFAEKNAGDRRTSVGATTILIDKETNQYLRANAFFQGEVGPPIPPTKGECMKN